jgi:Tol biopolymer transport system component
MRQPTPRHPITSPRAAASAAALGAAVLAYVVGPAAGAVQAAPVHPMTDRVSVSSAGVQGNGMSAEQAISADGRYIAFESDAANLVAGDTNKATDVFVQDRRTGRVSRVSVSSSEGQGSGGYPAISADGRYVAFVSYSAKLVRGDTNGAADIFVRDRRAGTTSRVSVARSGGQGNAISFSPDISADGRYVTFLSDASDLVAADTNHVTDVFVRDRRTGTTNRINLSVTGRQGNNTSSSAAVSADGRRVAFSSTASNLVAGDTNAVEDVFVRDLRTAATTRISVSSTGSQANGTAAAPAVSADGRYVTFSSTASNLTPGHTDRSWDVFVRDLRTSTTTWVSPSALGTEGDSAVGSLMSVISGNGRYVSFMSTAANLVAGDTNGVEDVFVRDLRAGITTRASVSRSGIQANAASRLPQISADGRYITFFSYASNLVAADTNQEADVFVHRHVG